MLIKNKRKPKSQMNYECIVSKNGIKIWKRVKEMNMQQKTTKY